MDDVTIKEEFKAVFYLYLHCRHNKSNAKTLGITKRKKKERKGKGKKEKTLYTLTSQSFRD